MRRDNRQGSEPQEPEAVSGARRLGRAQLALLADVSQALILGDGSEAELLTAVFGDVARAVGAEMYVNFEPPDGESMRLSTWGGLTDDERALFATMRYGELLCGRVAASRERLVVDDIANSVAPGTEAVKAAGYGAYAGFPLLVGDRLLGTVAFIKRTRSGFSGEEVELVQAVCDQAAAMLERLRLTRRLGESEERLRLFIEHAPAAIAMLDRDLRYMAASRRWLHDYHLTGDLTGRRHYEIFPRIKAAWREANQRALAGESLHSEGESYRGADGSQHWIRWDVLPWRDAAGAVGGIIVATEDVTDRRRAEAQLRQAHDTFRHLVQSSPFGVYVVDADFRLVQVSSGAQKVFESVRPLLGRDLAEVLRTIWPEPFASEAIGRFRHTLATGEPYHAPRTVESRYDIDEVEAYDWQLERVMLPDGRPGVVCHFYDLSERQRYESALQEQEEQLRLALGAAEAGSWRLDLQTGELVASARALELVGLSPDAPASPERALVRAHPDDRDAVRAAVARTAKTGEPLRIEHRVVHADGSIHWIATQAERRASDSGMALYGLVQDATRRKRAEAALRAREALERETALSLQRALLPPRPLRSAHVETATRYVAGSAQLEVGGDWYDGFALDDGRIGFTMGDVIGHGLPAAAAMGQLRTALAALAPHFAPAALLEHLDAFLARTGVTDFATVCYARYDPDAGVLDYASAGHPPMLAVSPGGGARWLDAAQSPPLTGAGTMHLARRESRIETEPGTLLVLYTDGLIERRGEVITAGFDRLEAAAKAVAHRPLEEVCDDLLHQLGVDEARPDDVALMVVRLAPSSTAGVGGH